MTTHSNLTPSISCIVPAFNEGGNRGVVLPPMLAALKSLSPQVEIVVVNDESVRFGGVIGMGRVQEKFSRVQACGKIAKKRVEGHVGQ